MHIAQYAFGVGIKHDANKFRNRLMAMIKRMEQYNNILNVNCDLSFLILFRFIILVELHLLVEV